MLEALAWVFWISLLIVGYSYAGYGLLLYALVAIRRRTGKKELDQPVFEPEVTLLIAAYNEESFIREKIANTLELEYPEEKLTIVLVTDGSTDNTAGIVSGYRRIVHLHDPERRGKQFAVNRAMKTIQTPIVVFSDANTLLNRGSIRAIVRHYRDERVGGVAGEKKVITRDSQGAVGGEGIYWKYESFLKRLDAELYTVVGAAGELWSMRSALFVELSSDILLDDFVQSMYVCGKGYRMQYEPGAYAMETSSANMREEQKRKIRISAGGFQSIVLLKSLLNPFRYPLLSFQYISHRVLRWTICPLCLVLMLGTNFVLVVLRAGWVYDSLLAGQLLFYGLATGGWIMANRGIRRKAFFVPYYFLFMNVSVFLGFFRYIRGSQSTLWEKARRAGELETLE
jgi:cellulose synthase/poly-beta-1,6-N-acetylglucosamine synthase-like glycosyltransferase